MVQIGLMDSVYQSARAVVVALNDIEISAFELEALQDYVQMYEAAEDPPQALPHFQSDPSSHGVAQRPAILPQNTFRCLVHSSMVHS
jgi:hypothetical protein